jgi:superoxide dismutase, Cu-Zn family
MAGAAVTQVRQRYELPGNAVFPESIGVDAQTGDAYVGSLADGTLYRIGREKKTAEIWSPGGADARGSVAGVKIDPRRRLWAAGGYDGTLWIYDLEQRRLLARSELAEPPTCVNDIAFGPGGDGFVTDSFVPYLFRVDAESLAVERWVDLQAEGVPWPDGLNLNGIVLARDGRHLVSCQTNTGRLWRISLDSGSVQEVEVPGGPFEHADGLARDGSFLYVAINARQQVAVLEVQDNGAAASLRTILRSDAFAFPTAVALRCDDLLVVNAQLDRMNGAPELPFTVVAIEPAAAA